MRKIIVLLLTVLFLLTGCNKKEEVVLKDTSFDYYSLPEYEDDAYVVVNNNVPFFNEEDISTDSFEVYSELDELGRCGAAFANVSKETMPESERESIYEIKPSGWHSIDYEGIVEGSKLYNRCHLIAWKLAGENANELNLITGTRYLNNVGMTDFEEEVYEYISNTDNHVLYRVTPVFIENELIARGVLMEAYSVEDQGKGICYNVFCYNVQPMISIDYLTGDSKIDYSEYSEDVTYILNTNSKKIHQINCEGVNDISKKNIDYSHLSIDTLLKQGYSLCPNCN